MFQRWKQTKSLTYLGEGSEFQGDLCVRGSLRVDGSVRGNVEASDNIEISATGTVEGEELRGGNILVYGTVRAQVVAKGTLTLSKSSRLEGDVVASALHIEEGASYTGHIATADTVAESGNTALPNRNSLQLPGTTADDPPEASETASRRAGDRTS